MLKDNKLQSSAEDIIPNRTVTITKKILQNFTHDPFVIGADRFRWKFDRWSRSQVAQEGLLKVVNPRDNLSRFHHSDCDRNIQNSARYDSRINRSDYSFKHQQSVHSCLSLLLEFVYSLTNIYQGLQYNWFVLCPQLS